MCKIINSEHKDHNLGLLLHVSDILSDMSQDWANLYAKQQIIWTNSKGKQILNAKIYSNQYNHKDLPAKACAEKWLYKSDDKEDLGMDLKKGYMGVGYSAGYPVLRSFNTENKAMVKDTKLARC